MGFLLECISFIVTGSAKYGRDITPLDEMNRKAEMGLDIAEEFSKKRKKSKPKGS